MAEETILFLDILGARGKNLLPMYNRCRESAGWIIDQKVEENTDGAVSRLLKRYWDNQKILAVITGNRILSSHGKMGHDFRWDLDVNQNKILNKIRSNDVTLIRSQSGTGATTLSIEAASQFMMSGKSVLYITDQKYHRDSFLRFASRKFDASFVLNLDSAEQLRTKNEFSGVFRDFEDLFL